MTDDDFDKVDEDFASEFDFVDNKDGGGGSSGANKPEPPHNEPPKSSSSVVTLMIIISILGGGYYVYSNFIAKKPAETPAPPKPDAQKDIPTLPEHAMDTTHPAAPTTGSTASAAPPAVPAPNPSDIAEALNKTQHDGLAEALPTVPPSTATGGDKTFEQLKKDVHNAQQQTTIPTAHAQPTAPVQPVVPQEVRNALQTISDDMNENINNIRQLESTLSNMASSLDHLNRTISAMDNRVLALTETVDGLSQDLTNVKRVMVEQDLDLTMPGNVKMATSGGKKQIQSISSSEPNYNVHAIIPGRAWLKSANGQIITVTEGDKIGDYGTVAVIDAANGLVRTSSGIIIR